MRRGGAVVALAVAVATGARVAPSGAQGLLDRNPVDFHAERVSLREPRVTAAFLFAKPAPSDTVGTWTLQPRISFSAHSSGSGMALTYANKQLFSSLPFNASLSEKAISAATGTHNRFQLDAELDPDLSAFNPALSAAIAGEYLHTATVGSAFDATSELDLEIPDAPGLTLGIAGHLDQEDPVNGPIRNGPTAGFTADWRIRAPGLTGRAEVGAEYDLKSDFSGEDSFDVKAMYALYRAPRIVLVGGFQKHDVFLVALKTSFAMRRSNPAPGRRTHR